MIMAAFENGDTVRQVASTYWEPLGRFGLLWFLISYTPRSEFPDTLHRIALFSTYLHFVGKELRRMPRFDRITL